MNGPKEKGNPYGILFIVFLLVYIITSSITYVPGSLAEKVIGFIICPGSLLLSVIFFCLTIWNSVTDHENEEKEEIGTKKKTVPKDGESQWCLVGNIVEKRPYGEGGLEMRSGAKHFSPGTKIYAFPAQWGDGYEKIIVVGRHRGSKKFVTMVIRSDWVTNWRVKVVYNPEVLRRLQTEAYKFYPHSNWADEEEVQAYVDSLKKWEKERNEKKLMGFSLEDLEITHLRGCEGKNSELKITHIPSGICVGEEYPHDSTEPVIEMRNRLLKKLRTKVDEDMQNN